jgi:hypothetical protein
MSKFSRSYDPGSPGMDAWSFLFVLEKLRIVARHKMDLNMWPWLEKHTNVQGQL